jgi:hypothetical protein
MAEYLEGLLAQTPIDNEAPDAVLLSSTEFVPMAPTIDNSPRAGEEEPAKFQSNVRSYDDLLTPDIPLADPPVYNLSGTTVEQTAPDPTEPIFIVPQWDSQETYEDRALSMFIEGLKKEHEKTRSWEVSQKEPLVEVPIKRTKQYFAIIREMEDYNAKRAAKALDGTNGQTLLEKEEGLKMFQQFFGGLRSLDGMEKYQGTPPWELEISARKRRALANQVNNQGSQNPTSQVTTTSDLSPVDSFRQANSTELVASRSTVVKSPKERVVWRFEDVSWVKQRTSRPRKNSYVGRLDHRARTESGVARYGPFGIGSGLEGVGGVRQVLERGRDGRVRVGHGGREKKRVRREIVV